MMLVISVQNTELMLLQGPPVTIPINVMLKIQG